MKKIFSIFAASLMLFAASCSTEKLDEPTGDGNVTFTVQLPGGLQSRALGDGTTATKLYVSVYEKDGNSPLSVSPATQAINLNQTVTLQLVTGKTYDIVFWAQAANAPYTYNANDRTVAMNYGTAANAENRDAFFYIWNDFTVTGPMNETVTLKRPFAQLNFATSDWDAAVASGLNVATTSVEVKQLLPTLNLDNGLAEGTPADVTFTDAALPGESITIGGNAYKYLALNYLLMDATRSTVDVKLTAKESASDLRVLEVSSVPVQRNYRTNIYGALLTSTTTYNVTIAPAFDGDNNGEAPDFFAIGANGRYYPTISAAIASLDVNGTAEQNVITLGAGEFSLPSTIDRNLTIEAAAESRSTTTYADAKLKFTGAITASGKDLVFKGVKMEWPVGNYNGIQHNNSVTFTNCSFSGTYFCYGNTETFDGCTFEGPTDAYSIWTYGAKNVNIKDCTFASDGKAILVYNESSSVTNNITISGTTFTASQDRGKAAVEIHSELGTSGTLTITNSTATGFKTAGLWQELNNGTKVATHKFTTTVDGKAYYLNGVTIEGDNEYGINTALGLFNFAKNVNISKNSFNGKTVKLLNDIDLNNEAFTPVGQTGATQFMGTFDGQNYTIKNLKINNESTSENTSTGLFGWLNTAVVKNVKVEEANVEGHHYVGVIAGYMESIPNCTIENCHVSNAAVTCSNYAEGLNEGDKCGGIVGFAGNAGSSVKGCSVSNSTVKANRDAGQVVGCAKEEYVTDCTATNVTVSQYSPAGNGSSSGANINNAIIGREL